jgi:hypothetical protein
MGKTSKNYENKFWMIFPNYSIPSKDDAGNDSTLESFEEN